MNAAAKLFGTFKGGRPVHPSTVSRWASAGVVVAGGTRLRLEAVRLAGRLVTSRAAVVRFVQAQQDSPSAPEPPATRSLAERHRAARAAAAELGRMGA